MEKCKHKKLTFWSGGFFIACMNCDARWAAAKNISTPEQVPDLERGGDGLSLTDIRVAK